MRCPKCGYISFDHLERCKKCGKDVAEVAADFAGTVFETTVPAFLQFEAGDVPGGEGGQAAETGELDVALDLDGAFDEAETELEVNLDEGEELVLGEGGEDDALAGEGLDTALAGLADDMADETEPLQDAGDGEEPVLELGGDQPEESGEIEGLQLDFGDIDISDLAPPVEEQEEVEELTLDSGAEPRPAMAPRPAPAAGMASGGLEDLEIDGLDLDAPPPVAGSAAGGRLPPAVKTGTALDDFDIDLGDLLAEEKSEKA
ncbi:MAG TPA: hypothetical protein ENK27_10700 [Desulfobulbus sp.]|nr:hypothetical protein [Desulfobulbus sp.]